MDVIEKTKYLEIDIKCQMHEIILRKINPNTVEGIVNITNAFKCPGNNKCKINCKGEGESNE